ncbi:MAG: site-specific integrase [Gammaproteobacteria bacterium]|nr:site-specific integrase [Gammaproteobacteria bacterium]
MNSKTKADYIKLATHFIQVRLLDNNITPTEKNIRQALLACAVEYRSAYWRRLRCALVTQQIEAGFAKTAASLKSLRNPVTHPDASDALKAQKKPKQKRVKTVKPAEHSLLKKHIIKNRDRALLAILEIALILGCRPIEMMTLQARNNNQLFITGAKKTEKGDRGLDRTVTLSEKDFNIANRARLELLEYQSAKQLSPEQLQKRLQRRLATATKQLWPRRKHRITLYSYRHLMGSALKASEMSRIEIAAIMGHQSVDSVNVYGNSRRHTRRKPSVRAAQESINAVRKTQLHNAGFLLNMTTSRNKISPNHRETILKTMR